MGRDSPSVTHAKGSCLGSWTQPAGLPPRRGLGLKGETFSLLPGTAVFFEFPPCFPAHFPLALRSTFALAIFLIVYLGRRLGGRVGGAGRGEGTPRVCSLALACPAVSCPLWATARRPRITPFGAPRWCFSLVFFHLHVRTCNIFIACFPSN